MQCNLFKSFTSQCLVTRKHGQSCPLRAASTGATAYQLSDLSKLTGEEMGLVTCGYNPAGFRGLIASESALKQCLISIPIANALVLTDEPLSSISVFGDRCQDAWQASHGDLPDELVDFLRGEERWDVRMTAWVLWLSKNASKLSKGTPYEGLWQTYVDNLPEERYMSCLLNYTESEAVELQDAKMIKEAAGQHAWVKYLHDRFFSKGASGSKSALVLQQAGTTIDTAWANAMVRSRTFSEEVGGEGVTLMVPWADLANHAPAFNSTFCISKDKQSFELRSVRPLSGGEEVQISYGDDKANSFLMRDYGFVVPGNPHDRIPVPGQDLLTELTEKKKEDQEVVSKLIAQGRSLNGASLCEAMKMTGDFMKARMDNAAQSGPSFSMDDYARRINAVLSFPLHDGFNRYGGICDMLDMPDGGQTAQQTLLQGGLPWARPFTDAGRPSPRLLQAKEVTKERETVSFYRQHVDSLYAELGTTRETDYALLSSAQQDGLTARHQAAIRFRLEYKEMLAQGQEVLALYQNYLDQSTNLNGSR